MLEPVTICRNGLNIVFDVSPEGYFRLLHFSALPFDSADITSEAQKNNFRLVELEVSGVAQLEHRGSKHLGSVPGTRLLYRQHNFSNNEWGQILEIELEDPLTGLQVTSHLQFFDDIPVVKSWNSLLNAGNEPLGLEYAASFTLSGISKEGKQGWEKKMKLYLPHNSWQEEVQWREYSLPELGLVPGFSSSMKRILCSSAGSWSSGEYLPMGYLENQETGSNLFWQIEHNGSWLWEISDVAGQLYLHLSGPTEDEHHWWKQLQPGASFETVPVVIGSALGGFDRAMGELTRYRRVIRRPNQDNEKLAVIFNDYMNCLWGDPTTAKLLPIIDAAAEAGCEYFCIDAGWYTRTETWSNELGEWWPNEDRFPGGFKQLLAYITSKGMVPGVWLELEMVGVITGLARTAKDDWFFQRHGKRVSVGHRYQLDFRNPEVIAFADETMERMVNEYGVGYIKLDYNANMGMGTELNSDSFGEGLLQHNRAYLEWLDRLFARYPDLVIENCGSGGLRMDYALLSRHSIQSVTDQTDYLKMAVIAANCASAATPEQAAIWSYPLDTAPNEEVIFNMVNAILLRVHLSGKITEIGAEGHALIKEGIEVYKGLRSLIPNSLPVWPLGLHTLASEWACFGLKAQDKLFLAVWRLKSEADTCLIPLADYKNTRLEVGRLYPARSDGEGVWQENDGNLRVVLPQQCSARLFELKLVG